MIGLILLVTIVTAQDQTLCGDETQIEFCVKQTNENCEECQNRLWRDKQVSGSEA